MRYDDWKDDGAGMHEQNAWVLWGVHAKWALEDIRCA